MNLNASGVYERLSHDSNRPNSVAVLKQIVDAFKADPATAEKEIILEAGGVSIVAKVNKGEVLPGSEILNITDQTLETIVNALSNSNVFLLDLSVMLINPALSSPENVLEAVRRRLEEVEAGAKQPVASELPDGIENTHFRDRLKGPEVLAMVKAGKTVILMQGINIYASIQAFNPETDDRLAGNPLANYGSEAFWRLLEEKGSLIVFQNKRKLFTITLLKKDEEVSEGNHGAEEPAHNSREVDEKDFWSAIDLTAVSEKIEGGEAVEIKDGDGNIIATIQPFLYPQDDTISTARFTCLKEGRFWETKENVVLFPLIRSRHSSKPKKFATVVFKS